MPGCGLVAMAQARRGRLNGLWRHARHYGSRSRRGWRHFGALGPFLALLRRGLGGLGRDANHNALGMVAEAGQVLGTDPVRIDVHHPVQAQ